MTLVNPVWMRSWEQKPDQVIERGKWEEKDWDRQEDSSCQSFCYKGKEK